LIIHSGCVTVCIFGLRLPELSGFYYTGFEVLTAMLLKIEVFYLKTSSQGEGCLTQKTTIPSCFEMEGTAHPATVSHVKRHNLYGFTTLEYFAGTDM
jgi:hypothetical protein